MHTIPHLKHKFISIYNIKKTLMLVMSVLISDPLLLYYKGNIAYILTPQLIPI